MPVDTALPPIVVGASRSARYRRLMEALTIRDESGHLVPMRFSQSQEILWQAVAPQLDAHAPVRVCVLKGRQVFSSTFFQALTFVRTIETPGTKSLVIAHDLDTSHELFDKAKIFYEHLPLPRLHEPKVKELIFPFPAGASKYTVVSAGTMAKGRGTTQTCLHISELPHWPHAEVYTGLIQAVPDLPDTIIGVESTAKGVTGQGETFYRLWKDSVDGTSGFTPVFIPWHAMKKYRRTPAVLPDDWNKEERLLAAQFGVDGEQLAWRRYAIRARCEGSVDLFHQEFPSCLVFGTRISTERGIIPIGEAETARETESGHLTGFFPKTDAPVLRVTTEAGRLLVGTPNHPLQRPDGTFVALGASLGAYVALTPPRFAENTFSLVWSALGGVTNTLRIDETWARFLGYFMGDGCYSCGAVSIACDAKDTDVIDDVRRLFTTIFGAAHERSVGAKKGCVELRVGVVAFADIMRRLGIWNDAEKPHRKVCVPEAIFRSPRAVVREFLRGLFESDGFNGFNTNRVVLFSKWPTFLRDVQLLLLGFGVTSRVKSRPTHTGRYAYIANTLELRSREAIKFNEVIGFVGARKRARGRPVSRYGKHLAKPLELLDRVVSVADAGTERVYDITVEGAHTFCANGIVVHNSPEEAFIASGQPAFDRLAISEQRQSVGEPASRWTLEDDKLVEAPKGEVRVWEEPEAGHQYVIGADTAEGLTVGDFTCAEILDMESLRQVASIHGKIPFFEFAKLLNAVGRWYNKALLAIEVYPQGFTVQDYLIRLYYYPNLHLWRGKPDQVKLRTRHLYGWETNVWSRPLLIAAGQKALNHGLVTIREAGLIDELVHYSKNDDGKYEASVGHDDRVMALLIALRSREENYAPLRSSTPEVSDALPSQIVVAAHRDSTVDARRRLSKLLRDKAREAVTTWNGWMHY